MSFRRCLLYSVWTSVANAADSCLAASRGCSEPNGENTDSSFISKRGRPAGLGQEEGVNAGGCGRLLTWQTVFPVGSPVRVIPEWRERSMDITVCWCSRLQGGCIPFLWLIACWRKQGCGLELEWCCRWETWCVCCFLFRSADKM